MDFTLLYSLIHGMMNVVCLSLDPLFIDICKVPALVPGLSLASLVYHLKGEVRIQVIRPGRRPTALMSCVICAFGTVWSRNLCAW